VETGLNHRAKPALKEVAERHHARSNFFTACRGFLRARLKVGAFALARHSTKKSAPAVNLSS
jgi:hypothetical protein